jgi:FAD synthetase
VVYAVLKREVDPDRIRKYINGVESVLNDLETILASKYPMLLDAAKRYLKDSMHYLEKGDLETSLVTISYAEGLIDALKYIGELEASWPTLINEQQKVFLAGTFDIIHPGHIELFKWASSFGKLYVVVARDVNVQRNKGRKPVIPERARLKIIQSIRYVYEARLGDEEDIFKPIEEIRPDIIVLGPDQTISESFIERELESRLGYKPVVKRYPAKESFEGIRSSSDIIRKICYFYCDSLK